MWKSRLEGLDVIPDVETLANRLHDFSQINQLVVVYNNTMSKIKRLDYFPSEDGKVVFEPLDRWLSETAYSVSEMLEFLEKYGELIKEVWFKVLDGSEQRLVNLSETCDSSGVEWYTNIIVGDGSETFNSIQMGQQTTYNPNVKIII